MNILLLFFTGFIIGITGAMIPGPLTFFTVSETLKSDSTVGFRVILGHMAIEAAIIAILVIGLHRILTSEIVLWWISIIGGLALIIMGGILFTRVPSLKIDEKKHGKGFSKGLFIGGIFFSIASPGFIIWWATIGISTIAKALLSGMFGVIVFVLGHWAADILWYWLISYATDKGKTYLTDSSYRNVVKVFSALLILLGGWFLKSA